MTKLFVSLCLRLLLPVTFGGSLYYFLHHLAIPAFISGLLCLWLSYLLSQQGARNGREYLLNREAGLTKKSPLWFVFRFSFPFLLAIPAAFTADWLDWKYGFFIPSVTGLLTGAIIYWLALSAIMIVYGPLRSIYLGGRQILSYRDALLTAKRLGYTEGLLFGGVRLPLQIATTHFLIVGASGSGKTVTIQLLLQGITDWMRQQQNSQAVIYDPKSNMIPKLQQLSGGQLPIVDFHPFREQTYAWDIANDIRLDREIEPIVNILLPQEKNNPENRFFAEAPRELMQNVIRALRLTAPGNWTLRDVYLIMTSEKYLKTMLSRTAEGEELLPRYFRDHHDRTLSDIQLSVRTRLLRYRTIAAAHHQAFLAGRVIRLREWGTSGNGFLVLGADKAEDSGIGAFNRVVLFMLAKAWLEGADSPRSPRHFLILDEVQSAGTIDALGQLLNEGREKGVSAILGFQDISSLRAVYGPDIAEALTAQCAQKAFLRMEGETTPQWASRVVGEVDQYEYTYSHGTTTGTTDGKPSSSTTLTQTERFSRQAALKPSDFSTLPATNEQNGLSGYYGSREIGIWKQHYPAEELWQKLDAPTAAPNGTEIDSPLVPFDDADRERLRLSSSSSPPTDEGPGDAGPGWDHVRNDWLDDEDD